MREQSNKRSGERSNKRPKEPSNERLKHRATRKTREWSNKGQDKWVECPGWGLPAWHGVQVEFKRMIGLATHLIIFTSRVESLMFEIHDDEKLQNKIEKYITPCQLANAINPAKRDAKWVRNERAMLNFRTEYLTMHPIKFPFWEHAASHSHVCPPLHFVVGRHKIDWGLRPRRYVLY